MQKSSGINVQNKSEEIVNYETRENSNQSVIFENSQSNTTTTSSTVTIPKRFDSESTTGTARKLY